MSEIFLACKDLIADAKTSCAKLVFKDVCLDILSKARLVLSAEQFEALSVFVTENLKEEKLSGRRIIVK